MSRVPVRPLLAHHHEFEYGPADYGRVSAGIRRVSWAAIVAGAVVALAAQLGLASLGAALGIPAVGMGGGVTTWAGAWLVGSALLALFAGGLVAGRLAGMPTLGSGALHGFVAWALAVLLGATVLAAALAAPGTTVAAGDASEAGEPITPAAPAGPVDLSEIQAEAEGLLLADTTATDAGVALAAAIEAALGGPAAATDAQQDALVAALADATDLTEAQARQTVGRWIVRIEGERGGLAADPTVPIQLEGASGDAPGTLWTALALLLGALAAALGGAAGTPGTLPVAPLPIEPVRPDEPAR